VESHLRGEWHDYFRLEAWAPRGLPDITPDIRLETPQTPQRKRVAVLVAHGMGQQVPYETIDGVAQATQRGAQDAGATIKSSVIRTVRLGTLNKDDIEAHWSGLNAKSPTSTDLSTKYIFTRPTGHR
jgi:hypothetical protein